MVLSRSNDQDVVFIHPFGVVFFTPYARQGFDLDGCLDNFVADRQASDALAFEPLGAFGICGRLLRAPPQRSSGAGHLFLLPATPTGPETGPAGSYPMRG